VNLPMDQTLSPTYQSAIVMIDGRWILRQQYIELTRNVGFRAVQSYQRNGAHRIKCYTLSGDLAR